MVSENRTSEAESCDFIGKGSSSTHRCFKYIKSLLPTVLRSSSNRHFNAAWSVQNHALRHACKKCLYGCSSMLELLSHLSARSGSPDPWPTSLPVVFGLLKQVMGKWLQPCSLLGRYKRYPASCCMSCMSLCTYTNIWSAPQLEGFDLVKAEEKQGIDHTLWWRSHHFLFVLGFRVCFTQILWEKSALDVTRKPRSMRERTGEC